MYKLRSILLVDDDPICTWLNRSLLDELKISEHIICLHDAQSALDYLEGICDGDKGEYEPLPSLILLDLNMPGIDGFEFLEKIDGIKNSPVPLSERVVILSSSRHNRDLEKVKKYKIRDYLTKPLTLPKITAVLDALQKDLIKELPAFQQTGQDRKPYKRNYKPEQKNITAPTDQA